MGVILRSYANKIEQKELISSIFKLHAKNSSDVEEYNKDDNNNSTDISCKCKEEESRILNIDVNDNNALIDSKEGIITRTSSSSTTSTTSTATTNRNNNTSNDTTK